PALRGDGEPAPGVLDRRRVGGDRRGGRAGRGRELRCAGGAQEGRAAVGARAWARVAVPIGSGSPALLASLSGDEHLVRERCAGRADPGGFAVVEVSGGRWLDAALALDDWMRAR